MEDDYAYWCSGVLVQKNKHSKSFGYNLYNCSLFNKTDNHLYKIIPKLDCIVNTYLKHDKTY